jgi:hypothetical protein
MANQIVRPESRREFMNKLVDTYDPRYPNPNEVFSEKVKLGQPETNRALEISVNKDEIKDYKIGIQDFDEALMYYFVNVLKPSVIQNNTRLNVPVLYGTPENWKAVQADGYYRDRNDKLLAPLIMYKRRSVTQNRGLGSKIDGNAVKNLQLFEKKFSKRNVYSNFYVLSNRAPEVEYVASITPDYVTVDYECMIWTHYIEQMDKLVESINFASRTYWGDPNKFQFYTSVETFEDSVSYEVGQDRTIRSTFSLTLNGYLIPDSINKSLASINRVYGVSRVVFGLEIDNSLGCKPTISSNKNTLAKTMVADGNRIDSELIEISSRQLCEPQMSLGAAIVADGNNLVINQSINITQGAPFDQAVADYLSLNTQKQGTYVNSTTVTFDAGWANAPAPLPANNITNFSFFVNGMYVEQTSIVSFTDNGSYSTLVINPTLLGYSIEATDYVLAIGKFA